MPLIPVIIFTALLYAIGFFLKGGFIEAKKYLHETFFNLKRITVDAWNS